MTTLPIQIRKRNGQITAFDANKIVIAVKKAFFAVTGDAHEVDAEAIAEFVVGDLRERMKLSEGEYVPSVEEVQDLVEVGIMQRGFFDVAKAYIIYRFEHAKVREHEQEAVKEKIERSELLVKNTNGSTELFSISKVRKAFEHAARGYGGVVAIDEMLEQLRAEVYDGITTRGIAHAMVLVARSFIERDPAYATIAARLLLQTVIYPDVIGKDHEVGGVTAYREAFVRNLHYGVEAGLIDERMLNFNLDEMAAALQPERDDLLKYLGVQTLFDRYFIRDKSDRDSHRILETPQMMWMRVAMGLALNEDEKEHRAKEFYELYSNLRFVSSTPTLFHSGTTVPQLASCYLYVVDDSLESIFKAYGDYSQMAKVDGGMGGSWSKLRATGALIKKTKNYSNGVVPFLKIADSATVAINRSGRRRGAHCVYLETWHYDIEDFLELRKNVGDDRRRTHDMNTSNWIPDLFMKRVRDDGVWTLFSPDETPDLVDTYGKEFEKRYVEYEHKATRGEIVLWKQVRARDLWKKMLTQLFETGHPWINFKDPTNVRSPQDHVGTIHNSNLCTEIALNTKADEEVAVCNLGSVNLARHMDGDKLNEALLAETVRTAMRMLDNVIDLTFYPIPETRTSNTRHRPIGLGVMGLQDTLFMQGIPFDSEEMVVFTDYVQEIVAYHAILGSTELARERGTYQSYKGSKWDRGLLPIDTLDLLEAERGEKVLVDRTTRLDWTPVREAIKQHGMRNSNCMAIAPTATIANIAGCFPAIEPIYKNIYVKANISGTFIVVNHYLVEDLKREGLWNHEMLELIKGKEGSIQNISAIPDWVKEKHKEVFEVDSRWLIKAAAHRAKWIDQSQSLNIFYSGTSGKEISEFYMYAWQAGLKTTYYLRTLGASGIEKSTVALDKQSNLEKRKAEEIVVDVREQVRAQKTIEAVTGESAEQHVATATKPKLCKLEDPDCESCQ